MYQHNYLLRCKLLQPFNKYNLWRKLAKKKKLTTKARIRLEWIIFYYTLAKKNATSTCKHFGVPRSIFYYWFSRFDDRNLCLLEDRPSIAIKKRTWNPDPIILTRMIKLRKKYIHWSKIKLSVLYKNIYDEKISSWQFQKVIQEFKIYPKRKIRTCKNNGAKKQLISFNIRNTAKNLYSLDTKVLWLFGLKYYIVCAVAHTGKLAYARAYRTHSSFATSDFLARLEYLLQAKPEIILTDNGSEFQKHFANACKQRNIKRYYSRIRTPKDNPEIERFIKTLVYEWLNDGNWHPNLHKFNKNITQFLITYNTVRPHEKLNYLTPFTYSQKHKLLSKRVSSSTEYCINFYFMLIF